LYIVQGRKFEGHRGNQSAIKREFGKKPSQRKLSAQRIGCQRTGVRRWLFGVQGAKVDKSKKDLKTGGWSKIGSAAWTGFRL